MSRCRRRGQQGDCTRASRATLGRSRSRPTFCGVIARVPHRPIRDAEEPADPLELLLRNARPGGRRTRAGRAPGRTSRGRARAAARSGRSRPAPDRRSTASSTSPPVDPADRLLVDVVRDQPARSGAASRRSSFTRGSDRSHPPRRRAGYVGTLRVVSARLAAEGPRRGVARRARRTSDAPGVHRVVAEEVRLLRSATWNSPGCRASCSCRVVVAHFMAPMTMKSGRRSVTSFNHPGNASRHVARQRRGGWISVTS